MADLAETCDRCNAPLIEIDHYGERLRGCLDCNRWIWCGSKKKLRRKRRRVGLN
ncbi:MAG TPA: hypothetical protein VMW05_00205 [Methyloceanibacter sp.]|nr:hypothetical protein [Methyloceanibacter sp.]